MYRRLCMNAPSIAGVTTVPVSLADRSFDILTGKGLVGRAGEELAKRLKGVRVAVVTDENVARAHLERLTASFAGAGIDVTPVIVAPGEKSKSFGTLETVTNAVLAARLERGDAVVALGGGVVGDLSGFVAGIVRRGMNFVQMPTSLLSQVDSSVGGKTGINTAHGKNLVGVFYQPQLVLADTEVLDTLSPREFRAGYAEVAKYGLIDRPDFFEWLERNWQEVFSGGAARTQAIAESCRCKAAVVARDERETGDRALLNLGHTFGHALETATGYDSTRLVHGAGPSLLRQDESVRHRGCGARRGASQNRRPAIPPVGCARRLAVCGKTDGLYCAGQESGARRAHLHPDTRYRPVLHCQGCAAG